MSEQTQAVQITVEEEFKPANKIEQQTLDVIEQILTSIPVKAGGFDRLVFVVEEEGKTIERVYKFTKIKKKGPPTPKTAAGIWKTVMGAFKK